MFNKLNRFISLKTDKDDEFDYEDGGKRHRYLNDAVNEILNDIPNPEVGNIILANEDQKIAEVVKGSFSKRIKELLQTIFPKGWRE